LEDWKIGRMEKYDNSTIGRLENGGWKTGRMEEWKNGIMGQFGNSTIGRLENWKDGKI
jgi:hypothetical protein